MDDQSGLAKLDSLLLQLALETRELSQKKEDLKQHIQLCRESIEKRKNTIGEIQKNVEKLQEQIQQKQNTLKCYKKNLNSLRTTGNFLLQYEKTLEVELERRRESCDEDMKMFEERIENYWKVFQQHKEEYCQNPLASKLLEIQANTEKIKERIRVLDEKIIEKEKELEPIQDHHIRCDSGQTHTEFQEQQAALSEMCFNGQDDASSNLQPQGTGNEQNRDELDMKEKAAEISQVQEEFSEEKNTIQRETTNNIMWTKPDIRCEQINEAEQIQQQTAEVEENMKTSGHDVMEDGEESLKTGAQQENAEVIIEEGGAEGAAFPTSLSLRMTTIQNTPTFYINPSTSPGSQERSETSAFITPLKSGGSTPTFSGFSCGLDVGSNQQEESPFTFTSSYFSNKKSPECKLPGFLFDDLESGPEEDFAFSFSPKTSQPNISSQETGGAPDNFPFHFSFDKF